MPNLSEIRDNRIKKIAKLRNNGINPYPEISKKDTPIKKCLDNFSKLDKSGKEITIAGRILSWRGHGGVAFLDIKDGTGKIQGLFRKDIIGEKGFNFFKEVFDLGDFIEVRGSLLKTKTGEKSIEVHDYKMLAKSIRPLPEKWHGIKDIEERFRKRYLDLIFNDEVREKFITRSKIVKFVRNFLEKEGFIEVETPILQPIYGGARAKPFKTHLNALDIDLYLRISPELYLKRLIIGGFEKVYEIGKCFRNEGMDKSHNPDFTMLEFYWAYASYHDLMKLTEKLFNQIVKELYRKTKIGIEGNEVDFKTPFKRIEFNQLLEKYTKIKYEEVNRDALAKKAKELGVKIEKEAPKAEIADEIYKKYCRPKIIQPTFIIHHPLGFQVLAKQMQKDQSKLANFQLIINGWEMVNAFSELNDPLEQERRFKEQESLFRKGLPEAQRFDKDFIEALEFGMPPTAGFGMGIDRLVALLTNAHSLREVILFPTMKPKETSSDEDEKIN